MLESINFKPGQVINALLARVIVDGRQEDLSYFIKKHGLQESRTILRAQRYKMPRTHQAVVHSLCTKVWRDMFRGEKPPWLMELAGLGIIEHEGDLSMAIEPGVMLLVYEFAIQYPTKALQLLNHNDISYICASIREDLASVDPSNLPYVEIPFELWMESVIRQVDNLPYTNDFRPGTLRDTIDRSSLTWLFWATIGVTLLFSIFLQVAC